MYAFSLFTPAFRFAFLVVSSSLLSIHSCHRYMEMPRKVSAPRCNFFAARRKPLRNQTTISQFFEKSVCPSCDRKMQTIGLCPDCKRDPRKTVLSMTRQMRELERKFESLLRICKNCTGLRSMDQNCENIECTHLFRFAQAKMGFESRDCCTDVIESLQF